MDTDKHGLQKVKLELRSKIRARLDKISAAARNVSSLQLRAKLKEQAFFQNAAVILFFAPLPDEIDLWPLLPETLAAGKIVALPQFDAATQSYVVRRVQNLPDEIVPGQFLVREPKSSCAKIPPDKIDLALAPGVAFDLSGNRLGRGRGFFDRLLAEVRGVKCGIAFEKQIVEKIPAAAHDVRVDFILTPARCVKSGE
jgi:5-formyltetrahydrofolate cyclo-ligase